MSLFPEGFGERVNAAICASKDLAIKKECKKIADGVEKTLTEHYPEYCFSLQTFNDETVDRVITELVAMFPGRVYRQSEAIPECWVELGPDVPAMKARYYMFSRSYKLVL